MDEQKRLNYLLSFFYESQVWGQRTKRNKLYAKCKNLADINIKCTVILARTKCNFLRSTTLYQAYTDLILNLYYPQVYNSQEHYTVTLWLFAFFCVLISRIPRRLTHHPLTVSSAIAFGNCDRIWCRQFPLMCCCEFSKAVFGWRF